MAAGPGGSGVCLKHDRQWRNKFQGYMNKISGPARRNPLISPSDIKRITKAVCICSQEVNQRWSGTSQEQFTEAHTLFKRKFIHGAPQLDYSRQSLRELYEYFQSNNMFTGSGSADRLIFIFSVKEQLVNSEILNDISPSSRDQPQEKVHLGSLRKSHIGRYIGRGGTGIREAVHGIPVGNIELNFTASETSADVDVSATYTCRPRNGRRISAALNHRRQFYEGDVAVPTRFRQPFRPNQVPTGPSVAGQPPYSGDTSHEPMES